MSLSKIKSLLKGLAKDEQLQKQIITPESAAREQLKKMPKENLTEDEEAIRRYYEKIANKNLPEPTMVDKLQKEMDTEKKIKEWAEKKGLPYREKNSENYINPEKPFDPMSKERKVDRESGTLRDIVDKNEPTIVSGGLIGGGMAMDQNDNDFMKRLKKALSDKYEEYGEKAGDAYNKMEDWTNLLEQKQKQQLEDTQKRFGMEPLSEEQQQLIDDIAMSSPAMGITKAVKVFGPEVGKFINKVNITDLGKLKSGEGLANHYKDLIANTQGRELQKFKGQTRKALDLVKKGTDIETDLPVKFDQTLNKYGDEVNMMLNDAARNVRNKSIPKDLTITPPIDLPIPDKSKKEALDILLEKYKDNPEVMKQIQKYINMLE